MAGDLMRRNIISSVEGVPQTFSSWNNCMSKAYCKWPAIAGIVIASLIVLSIVWCLARCLCCGASCCCSCLRCLDCFTPNRHGRDRDRNSRYKDDYRAMPNQGFQPMPSPMVYQPGPPQFATFDASTKIHEDSLPAMPSWENAQKRRVENHSAPGEDVEMGSLNTNNTGYGQQRRGYSQLSNNGPISPVHSPYGPHSTEYLGAASVAGAASHPYGSDLGVQHLSPQHGQGQARYSSDFQNAPMSPAPTYMTHDPQQNTLLASGALYAPGASPPSPEQYNRSYTHSPPQQPSQQDYFPQQPQQNGGFSHPSPYAPTISTQYEPSSYPTQSQYVSPTQGQGYRPPSLLQAGRKPVGGSLREI